jgi:ADP-ribose pyrophosphatase YjhB (NUDIX family)
LGYIEEIRELVGHKPIILNSALVIIKNKEEQVLLEYRNDTNNWGLPGGYMEPCETFEDTITRELAEELNVEIGNLHFF